MSQTTSRCEMTVKTKTFRSHAAWSRLIKLSGTREIKPESHLRSGGEHRCVLPTQSFERLLQPQESIENGKVVETEAKLTERREKPPSHRETNSPLSG